MVRAALIAARCGLAIVAGLALACAGCGDDAAPVGDSIATNGSRLIAERWVSADGTASFARWFDRELGIYCTFRELEGTARCLPLEASVDRLSFLDAACHEPAVRAVRACTEVRYANASGGVVHVNGPRVAGYVTGSDLPCQRYQGDEYDFYAPGEPVSLDTFVAADVVTSGTSMITTEYRGSDGSRQRVVLDGSSPALASAVNLACNIHLTGARSAECTFPTSAGRTGTHYSDDACTMQVIEPQGFPSQLTVRDKAQVCAPRPLYQLGELRSVPNVFYRDASGTCTSLQIIGTMVFDIAPIANATVPLTLEVDDATTRLRNASWVTPEGERWPGPLFDADLDTICVPRADDVGHARCVPALNEDTVDAIDVASSPGTCMQRTNPALSCWGQTVRARMRASSDRPRFACGYSLYDLEEASGPVVSGPLYTGDFLGECSAVDTTGAELRDGSYRVIDGTAYAEMTLQRD